MNAEMPVNPYLPDSDYPAPFVGRRDAFARLHHYLKDGSGALIIVGWPMVGKTAFLRQFDAVFDETFIGVYVSLGALGGESNLLRLLVDKTVQTLAARDFTLNRLPETPGTIDRDWLADTWLPEVRSAIRHHRHIVWLLDDAQTLTVPNSRFDPSLFAYLSDLLAIHPYLKLVLTIDTESETRLNVFGELVKTAQMIRLNALTREETAALLREPVSDLYGVTEDAVDEVFRATGGQPQWVQRYGLHIFNHRAELITASDVRALLPTIYTQSQNELEALWRQLNDNERLILSATGSLLYADPLRRPDSAAIAAWLVETDYPLDETSVHAAVRSLEYREILTGSDLRAGLLQKWLIENARLAEKSPPQQRISSRQAIVVLAIVIGILLAISLALQSGSANTGVESRAPQPTITLIPQQP